MNLCIFNIISSERKSDLNKKTLRIVEKSIHKANNEENEKGIIKKNSLPRPFGPLYDGTAENKQHLLLEYRVLNTSACLSVRLSVVGAVLLAFESTIIKNNIFLQLLSELINERKNK